MIELNSVWGILFVECFIGLIILVVVYWLVSKNKKSGEHAAIYQLIDKLEESEKAKFKKLSQMISQHCSVEPDSLNELLNEISQSEQNLYKQILQIFLNRDAALFDDLDLHIDHLSGTYLKMLAYSSANTDSSANAKKEKTTEDKGQIELLTIANERLGEQLTEAMSTMDEISAEYTRVYSGTQTELELENSKDNMFRIFKNAEQRVKLTLK